MNLVDGLDDGSSPRRGRTLSSRTRSCQCGYHHCQTEDELSEQISVLSRRWRWHGGRPHIVIDRAALALIRSHFILLLALLSIADPSLVLDRLRSFPA